MQNIARKKEYIFFLNISILKIIEQNVAQNVKFNQQYIITFILLLHLMHQVTWI